MHLTQLEAVRKDNRLVGWIARFTDDGGQIRLANLGLGCLMNPAAFSREVARQGIRYEGPGDRNPAAWPALVRQLTTGSPV